MDIGSFKAMYFAELQELANAEGQLAKLLLRLAQAASHPSLKNAFVNQQQNTEVQKEKLESVLRSHGANPRVHTDQAMQALLSETEKMLRIVKDKNLRDAGLIASTQKLKHYEIAAYGTAAALAGQLGFRDDQVLLHSGLEDKKQADKVLTQLAKYEINQDAIRVNSSERGNTILKFERRTP